MVHILLKPDLENFEHYFTSVWDECNCAVVWAFFGIAFLFQSCGHCWVFQISWHIECSTFTASSFRIWNSSTGIPSHPLASFVVMLPKAHLTSHSRMSVSRLVITPSWLFGLWRSFLYSSFVYSCHILISSASVGLRPFLYWAHLCIKCSLVISNCLKENSRLSHSIVFLYFFALITEEVFFTSPCCSLDLCIQMGISFLFSFKFSSVAQSCLTLCIPMNRSMPGLPVHHQLPKFTQTHIHRVGDAIQPSHSLSFPSPPAPNPSQHQDLF